MDAGGEGGMGSGCDGRGGGAGDGEVDDGGCASGDFDDDDGSSERDDEVGGEGSGGGSVADDAVAVAVFAQVVPSNLPCEHVPNTSVGMSSGRNERTHATRLLTDVKCSGVCESRLCVDSLRWLVVRRIFSAAGQLVGRGGQALRRVHLRQRCGATVMVQWVRVGFVGRGVPSAGGGRRATASSRSVGSPPLVGHSSVGGVAVAAVAAVAPAFVVAAGALSGASSATS
eukprot:scaffold15499_cov56-Phaeocystis_antarctica.AAC.4